MSLIRLESVRKDVVLGLVAVALAFGLTFTAQAQRGPATQPAPGSPGAQGTATQPAGGLVALPLKLPKAQYKETPKPIPANPRFEKLTNTPRPAFMVPKGLENLALKKPVTGSDKDPVIGSYKYITDGNKEADEGAYIEMGPGPQWVKIDLGKSYPIYAIAMWHYHLQQRVYHSVIVQAGDDPDFIAEPTTLFNSDYDNNLGMGVGKDLGYWESFEGKVFDAKGVKARYLRFYSAGSTSDELNHYTEIEVWGVPDPK